MSNGLLAPYEPTPELLARLEYVQEDTHTFSRTTTYLDNTRLVRSITWSGGLLSISERILWPQLLYQGIVPTELDFLRLFNWLGLAWRFQGEQPPAPTAEQKELMVEHLVSAGYELSFENERRREYRRYGHERAVYTRVSLDREKIRLDYPEFHNTTVFRGTVATVLDLADLMTWAGYSDFA